MKACVWLWVIATSARAMGAPHDALSLGATVATFRNTMHGFKSARITIQDPTVNNGEPCEIPFKFQQDPPGDRAPVLLLHGFTDAGDAFESYVVSARERKLPYRQFIMLDWPRHGNSKCEKVSTPEEAAKAIGLAVHKLCETYHLKDPGIILGASMGSINATYLKTDKEHGFPNAKIVLVTVPALKSAAAKKLVKLATTAESRKDAQNFFSVVSIKPKLPLGFITDESLRKRMVRAAPIVRNFDVEEFLKRLKTVPQEDVTIIEAKQDLLCPEPELRPEITEGFGSRIQRVDCAHNVARDCPDLLPVYW